MGTLSAPTPTPSPSRPALKPITLTRAELERLGLMFRDGYQLQHMDRDADEEGIIEAILNSLTDALARCRGHKEEWMRRNLQRALALVGELEEEHVRTILDQKGI